MKRNLAVPILWGFALLATAARLEAQSDAKEENRLYNSALVVKEAMGMHSRIPQKLLDKAACLIVIPSVIKGAAGFGGSYGRGAMSCRGGEDFNGPWTDPTMMALEGISFGLQLGGQATDFVLLVMDERGAGAILSGKFKIGGDAAASAGPLGRDSQANLDIYMRTTILSYSRSRGLFAGVSLEGSTLRPDNRANQKLYGKKLTARNIVLENGVPPPPPPSAEKLVTTLNKYGKSPTETSAVSASVPQKTQGEKVKVKGLITQRTGETVAVKTTDGTTLTVVLDDDTKVQQPKGLIGARKEQMSAAVLIPGLKVSVDGTSQDATHVLAKSITFDKDDLQTAEMIQAGLNPTEEKVAADQQNISANKQDIEANQQNISANKQDIEANQQDISANKATIDAIAAETSKRFSELSEYDTKDQLDVHFASGSSEISTGDQEALKKLAHDAVNLNGYVIQIKGYADSSGNAAMNQKLSMERAQNVIAFLLQTCNVPVRHIVAPGAMGEAQAVATNETSAGRAENRRVEVKVLSNKGLAGV